MTSFNAEHTVYSRHAHEMYRLLTSMNNVELNESQHMLIHSKYRFEAARLKSFESFPDFLVNPSRMAAAGLYYTGNGDRVRCFECKVEIYQWLEGNVPMYDHRRWRPQCRFVKQLPCGNVPLGVDPTSIPAYNRSRDVCGPYEHATAASPLKFHSTSSSNLASLRIEKAKTPVHPEFATYDARFKTFEFWPKSMPQTKEDLTEAGFYSTGRGDQTLCYHCGGGLKDWEANDVPWEQHARWFSKCYHLILIKGQDYINDVNGRAAAPITDDVCIAYLIECRVWVCRKKTNTCVHF